MPWCLALGFYLFRLLELPVHNPGLVLPANPLEGITEEETDWERERSRSRSPRGNRRVPSALLRHDRADPLPVYVEPEPEPQPGEDLKERERVRLVWKGFIEQPRLARQLLGVSYQGGENELRRLRGELPAPRPSTSSTVL